MYLIELMKRLYPLSVEAKELAPATYKELVAQGHSQVVWSGASDNTIYGSAAGNHLFRSWHDSYHLRHSLDFSTSSELIIAKLQAADIGQWSSFAADAIYADVAGPTLYFERHGKFPVDQVAFINSFLINGITGEF